MLVSIIIPCKNDAPTLGGVIDSCKNSLPGISKELLVVLASGNADGSTDICNTLLKCDFNARRT